MNNIFHIKLYIGNYNVYNTIVENKIKMVGYNLFCVLIVDDIYRSKNINK